MNGMDITMGNCQAQPTAAGKHLSSKEQNAKKPTVSLDTANKTPSSKQSKATTSGNTSNSRTIHENITVLETSYARDISDYYVKEKLIAQGSTCDVWKCRSKRTGELFALKVIPKLNPLFVDELRNEIAVLKKIDHPNIFRVYDKFESSSYIYMVSELLGKGNLYSQPFPYSEPRAAMVLTKILSAVTYLHKHHVCHRDLKLENVMYDDDFEPKLIDFGLSKPNVGAGVNMKCRVGTLVTMSPQVLKGQYTNKADIYAVGVIAYILLSGKRPFDGKTKKEITQKIVDGKFSMDGDPDWANISKPAKNFVKSLLSYDPDERPTAAEALRDPWLQKQAPLATPQPTTESMNRVKNALVQSARDGKLKRIAAMMIAYKTPNESLKELRDAFNAMDVNNHGAISLFEFRKALKGCGYSDEELKEMFQDIDVNGNGMINYTEFLAITMESRGRIEESRIKEAFDRIDTDGSGNLSRQELCSIMGRACTEKNCERLVDEIVDELDTANDGTFCDDHGRLVMISTTSALMLLLSLFTPVCLPVICR